jgi:CDP-glycerol glycerophosphotransferase
MRTIERPDITAGSNQRLYRYDWAGFEVDIDPALLSQENNKSRVWEVSVEVQTHGITRKGRLAKPAPGRAQRPPYAEVRPGVRARPYYTEQGQLEIRVARTAAEVTEMIVEGDQLTLRGQLAKPVDGPRLIRAARRGRAATVINSEAVVNRNRFSATLSLDSLLPPPDEIPEHERVRSFGIDWDLSLIAPDGTHRLRLAIADGVTDRRTTLREREVLVRRTWQGNLTVTNRAFRPEVRTVGWQPDGHLVLTGSLANYQPRPTHLILRRRHSADEHIIDMTTAGEDFRVNIPATALTSLRGTRPLRPGTWDLIAVCPCNGQSRHTVAVRLDHALLDALPGPETTGGMTFAVKPHGHDKFMITAGLDRPDSERGGYAQERLQKGLYAKSRQQSILDAVVFDTFRGKQYADNPRAIHEALRRHGDTRPHYWITREDQVELPDDIEDVRIWSERFYELMGRARHIVANDTLPEFFDKRADQVYVQTWHGTPLKRLAFDVEQLQSANPEKYLQQVTADVAKWDYLISPSRELTDILRRAFRYDGTILETGSPRGDLLFSTDRQERAARARKLIGLPDDRRVVLYAPTWRDNRFYGPGRYAYSSGLDVPLLRESLGADHVLLVRGHHLIDDAIPVDGVFSIDVSGYPEIYDLYLIADVLVTDYSGVMFDFAVTRKPIVFFAYDLELYRDQLRGFYFDYESIAPGPVLTTSAQVIEALRDIDGVVAASADRYARFVERFCEFDDGHAGDRVVEQVFGIR